MTVPHLIPSATNGHLTSSGLSNSAVKVLEGSVSFGVHMLVFLADTHIKV